jgi:hypothetical protein
VVDGNVLRPTPGRGVETLRYSYCFPSAAGRAVDMRRARRGMVNLVSWGVRTLEASIVFDYGRRNGCVYE